jgi:hypothetical protein
MGRRRVEVMRVMNRWLIDTVSLALFFTLLLALPPAAAQVATSNGQQSAGRTGQSTGSQAPETGVICIEEMTATFCNVVTGPNNAGYGSNGSSAGSGGGSGSSGGSGSGGGSGSSAGTLSNTSSIPPCSAFPPANELCN